MAHRPAVLAAALVLVLVAACGGQARQGGVLREAHAFNCCANLGGDTSWLPGQNVSLEWQVANSKHVSYSKPAVIKLTLQLRGPYGSITALKTSNAAPVVAQASHTVADSSAPPISILALPADLPPGFYNLVQKTDWGGGNSAGGASVVRIGP